MYFFVFLFRFGRQIQYYRSRDIYYRNRLVLLQSRITHSEKKSNGKIVGTEHVFTLKMISAFFFFFF